MSDDSKKKKGFAGQPSPEQTANILSKLTFWWANSLTWFGYKNVLEQEHLYELHDQDKSVALHNRIKVAWEAELQKPDPSYGRALLTVFLPHFALSWIFFAIYAASQFAGPKLLQKMVEYVVATQLDEMGLPHSEYNDNDGYYYAIALFGANMIGSFCLFQSNLISIRVGCHMRSVIVVDVFRKSLTLSNAARNKTSPGEIVNLMSSDAQRMVEVFLLLNNGLFAPFQIIVAIGMLYEVIGWITFVGFGFMLLTVPVNGVAAKRIMALRRSMVSYTDNRVKTTNEILQAIKIVKLYAWEDSFAQKVTQTRDRELVLLKKFARTRSGLIFLFSAVPVIVMVLVFSTYYGVHSDLNAAMIFAALGYLNLLKIPLGFAPMIIAMLIQLKVATGRITDFLRLPEIEKVNEVEAKEPFIELKDASFDWSTGKEGAFNLQNINLSLTGPGITAVVGSVGSGKSSVCQAILGEMKRTKGEMARAGSIAYVAQQAWIVNGSLRNNILFGRPYDEERYNMVLDACALRRDLELFPGGDLVEIGERGVNMSGGQKQRVSIARAVYSNSDIYIFDDPLSAVDAHVGKHLFHNCFNGILKGKLVILATNQLNYLPYCDHAVVMHNGAIAERGTYNELVATGKEFSVVLKEYGVAEKHEETEEEKKKKAETDPEKKKTAGGPAAAGSSQLVQAEEREKGAVSIKMYWEYFKAGGGVYSFFVILLFFLDIGAQTMNTYWLAIWSNDQYDRALRFDNWTYLVIFIALGVFAVIVTGLRMLVFFDFTVKSGAGLHAALFAAILRAPMSFFDTTPLGRIINRFSRDMDQIDNLLPPALGQTVGFFLFVLASIIVIATITPLMLAPLAPLVLFFFVLQRFYTRTSRELQRLESISRSPIFAHFSETLNGVMTLRAYKHQPNAIKYNHDKLDENNKCYITLQAVNQWLGLRLDLIGNLVIFLAAIFIVLAKDEIGIASVGLSLSYALTIAGQLNRATIMSADLETKMNSVERMVAYINGPVEALPITNVRPAAAWPNEGGIKFENFVMRYREGLDPVLRGISCTVRPHEKVGIVGRTGAGKSSIVLALFRLVEAMEGNITIDGENISVLGLKDLRSKLSIIPQDPVLFSGTLRENLDPFTQHDDAALWDVLENIQLKGVVSEMGDGLNCKVAENGENWSVGQRQLICLGRALLRTPKILVLDEATASVDSRTDQLIQNTVRKDFKNATILTIAHRLNTIMDSDRIMVLDAGKVAEFDTPAALLSNPNSLLTWLVNETGPQTAKFLKAMALGKEVSMADIQAVEAEEDARAAEEAEEAAKEGADKIKKSQ